MEVSKIQGMSDATPVAPVAALSPEDRASQRQLIQAVQSANSTKLFGENMELTFSYNRSAKKTVLQLVDRETKEVVRQVPPEYVLRLAEDQQTL